MCLPLWYRGGWELKMYINQFFWSNFKQEWWLAKKANTPKIFKNPRNGTTVNTTPTENCHRLRQHLSLFQNGIIFFSSTTDPWKTFRKEKPRSDRSLWQIFGYHMGWRNDGWMRVEIESARCFANRDALKPRTTGGREWYRARFLNRKWGVRIVQEKWHFQLIGDSSWKEDNWKILLSGVGN